MLPPTIVIIHDAFAHPAPYTNFIAQLHAEGLTEVRVPHLPSTEGGDPERDVPVVKRTIESCLTSGRDVLVLAHGYGGSLIGDAVTGVNVTAGKSNNAKLMGIVFVAGVIASPGESYLDAFEGGMPSWIQKDGTMCTINDPGAVFFNTLKDAEIHEDLVKHTQPQALSALERRVTSTNWDRVPCAYIICRQDHSMSVEEQQRMVKKLQRFRPTTVTTTLDYDHCPMHCVSARMASIVKAMVGQLLH
ncbi:hypothetical protein K470DRAFT_112168 [Piedraia hortae CBS 480.64]|uniref:AB hydrolase-1 domain-containing protein n=1 Tax=Piedraia hortae CBS 480.64 TaxID=1314780 RepID=A0A6A7BVH7_9PEZI|nr:hypothetical protein K470DRAFT_112168 [Piedraia hortae CBS 480.64]